MVCAYGCYWDWIFLVRQPAQQLDAMIRVRIAWGRTGEEEGGGGVGGLRATSVQ